MRLLILLVLLLAQSSIASAQLSSTNYQIDNYVVGTTEANATSTNYDLNYANDGTFIYDEPVVVVTSSGGGGGERISLVEKTPVESSTTTDSTETQTTEPAPEPEPEPVPIYIPPVYAQSTYTPAPTPAVTETPVEDIEEPLPPSEPEAPPVPAQGNLELTYGPGDVGGAVRATFGNGVVVIAKTPPTAEYPTTTIIFSITAFPLYDSLRPIEPANLTGADTMYQITARESTGKLLYTFPGNFTFSILDPARTLSPQASPYVLGEGRKKWELLEGSSVGTNIYTFVLGKSSTVAVWDTDGSPTELLMELPVEEEVEIGDEPFVAEQSTHKLWMMFDTLLDLPLWMLVAGLVFILLLVVIILFLVLRRGGKE